MTEHELFHTYNKDVYRTCLYMLKNSQDAEDVCHDVFVTVFRQDWSSVTNLKAWIMRITMNHCLNVIRKNKTKHEKQGQLQWLHDQASRAVSPVDSIVVNKLSYDELERQLLQLPEKLLSVVTLRYIGDLSIKEIAETLRIPQNTVRSRLYKALKLIRKKLERQEQYVMRGENRFGIY